MYPKSTSHKHTHKRQLPPSIRFETLLRDGFTCQYCGRRAPDVELHVDHIIPLSRGGTDDLDNLVTACSECNIGKSTRLIEMEAIPSGRR
ncbi:MAG: HNH endonuclease [Deltaproteobacteria bacterium]|nr:HNH endonuclease [Deltaproteobacteria bacterium]